MKKSKFSTYTVVYVGLLAALVYVLTLVRIPLMESKIHLGNATCLLAGLMLGGVPGGLAAGIGSGLYDFTLGGYGAVDTIITFVSKFFMGFVCGQIAHAGGRTGESSIRNILAGIAGALTYVVLYMLKTFIFQKFVYGYPMDAVGVTMLAKFVPSIINAVAAMILAPYLYTLLHPALGKLPGPLRSEREKEKWV